jgi:hypothetical protein
LSKYPAVEFDDRKEWVALEEPNYGGPAQQPGDRVPEPVTDQKPEK